MDRDNSLLNSGMTSNQAQKARERRKKFTTSQEVKRNKILPVGDMVMKEVDKQIKSISTDLANIIDSKMTDKELRILILAHKKAAEKLLNLRIAFGILLRDKGEEDE